MDCYNGLDIGPGDERMAIEVLTGFTEPGREGEPIYETRYVNRRPGSLIEEPVDISDHDSSVVRTEATNHQRPDHQKYQSERNRLKTFESTWKPEYNVSKEDLAQDGFIYKGPGDLVMCVFCLKSIRRWDAGDTVPGEHKRLYPRCPWVLGKVHHLNIPISKKAEFKRDMRLQTKNEPQYSDMANSEERKQTFTKWPRRIQVTIAGLVKAGFFYDDYKDTVTCYHCGVIIQGRDVEIDLFRQHARNRSCPMLTLEQFPQNLSPGNDKRVVDVALSEAQGVIENRASPSENRLATTDIDQDMNSAAVKAIIATYGSEYSMDSIRQAVEDLRLAGESGPIGSRAILEKLDPDF